MKNLETYLKAKLIHEKLYEKVNSLKKDEKVKLYMEYLSLIRKAAYNGNAEAQYELAQNYEDMNYLYLHNPNYNPKKCIYWYTKSAKNGHAAAQNNLASFYETGNGCKKNLAKALKLYKKSAELGYQLGKENYSIMLKQLNSK